MLPFDPMVKLYGRTWCRTARCADKFGMVATCAAKENADYTAVFKVIKVEDLQMVGRFNKLFSRPLLDGMVQVVSRSKEQYNVRTDA